MKDASQSPQASSISISGANPVANLRNSLETILYVVLGLCGLGAIIGAVIQMSSGESDGAKRFLWLFAGLLVGFIFVAGASSLNTGIDAGKGPVTSYIYPILSSLLAVVSAVTAVSCSVQLMNGSREFVWKSFVWMLASCLGQILLAVVANLG